jgi:hypothetical protein
MKAVVLDERTLAMLHALAPYYLELAESLTSKAAGQNGKAARSSRRGAALCLELAQRCTSYEGISPDVARYLQTQFSDLPGLGFSDRQIEGLGRRGIICPGDLFRPSAVPVRRPGEPDARKQLRAAFEHVQRETGLPADTRLVEWRTPPPMPYESLTTEQVRVLSMRVDGNPLVPPTVQPRFETIRELVEQSFYELLKLPHIRAVRAESLRKEIERLTGLPIGTRITGWPETRRDETMASWPSPLANAVSWRVLAALSRRLPLYNSEVAQELRLTQPFSFDTPLATGVPAGLPLSPDDYRRLVPQALEQLGPIGLPRVLPDAVPFWLGFERAGTTVQAPMSWDRDKRYVEMGPPSTFCSQRYGPDQEALFARELTQLLEGLVAALAQGPPGTSLNRPTIWAPRDRRITVHLRARSPG